MASIARTLGNTQITSLEKFLSVLNEALSMEENLPTGPDVLFSKTPRWSKYLLVFTNNYKGYAWAPEYEKADLSFLNAWVLRNGPQKMTELLVKLGYFDKRGMPKHRPISSPHRKQIIQMAKELYLSPISAT